MDFLPKTLFILGFYLSTTFNGYSINFYFDYIEYAEKAFSEEKYEDAGLYFDMAFERWEGYKEHLFEASKAWAYFGNREQAFYYINRAIDKRFYDTDFFKNDEQYINGLGNNYLEIILLKIHIESKKFESGINDSLRLVLLQMEKTNAIRNSAERLRIDSLYKYGDAEYDNFWQEIGRNDSLHTIKFLEIYEQHGWPNISLVGEEANKTAWFIVLHSDSLVQKKFLPIIKKSCEQEETPWKFYAQLYDQIIANHNGKVKYGSAYYVDKENQSVSIKFENALCVNYYREKVGLKPLKNHYFDASCGE